MPADVSGGARPRPSWLTILAPGILVATTGVGAGDLLTASIAGSKAGVASLRSERQSTPSKKAWRFSGPPSPARS